MTSSVDVLHSQVDQLGGQKQHDEPHDGSGQPQHQTVLHLLEDVHQIGVGPAWNILGCFKASAEQVNSSDDDEGDC